ncbi:hypothetical protein GCM10009621_18660 [Corynebacterium felinum]
MVLDDFFSVAFVFKRVVVVAGFSSAVDFYPDESIDYDVNPVALDWYLDFDAGQFRDAVEYAFNQAACFGFIQAFAAFLCSC